MESETYAYRRFRDFGDEAPWEFKVFDPFRDKILLCLGRNGPSVRFFSWHGAQLRYTSSLMHAWKL